MARIGGPVKHLKPEGLVELINFAKETLNPEVPFNMAEIGSYCGGSAIIFAPIVTTLVCVDPWENGYDNSDSASYNPMSEVEKLFDERTYDFREIITKAKLTSLEAAKEFKEAYVFFDLVYIDACHQYESVKEDILTWLPLVKKGGCISGHDYTDHHWPGVAKAVDEVLGKPDKIFSDSSWVKRIGLD